MPIEILGMVGTKEASETRGSWTEGPVVDTDYLTRFAQAHDAAGFDRVLIGYGATGPDGWAVASHVLHVTDQLKVLIAHRPGFAQPTLVARKAATLDNLSGGGRVAMHFITGGDEVDQKRDGDYADHDERYRRTAEYMAVIRQTLASDAPFDHQGDFYRYEGAFSSVKPATDTGIPLYFGGASAAAVEAGAAQADVYMLWGEPLAGIAERVTEVRAAAARHGRTVRFSLSTRPILADTEEAAWARAEEIARITEERLAQGRSRQAAIPAKEATTQEKAAAPDTAAASPEKVAATLGHRGTGGARSASNTSIGRERLLAFAQKQDVYDERLWTKVANLTGAGGNSTALVGTPEQVAEALLRYYDLGVTTHLIRGFDPYEDAIDYGRELLPLLREGAAKRDADRGEL
jgi:alkanesulfonate monooxygenase